MKKYCDCLDSEPIVVEAPKKNTAMLIHYMFAVQTTTRKSEHLPFAAVIIVVLSSKIHLKSKI